MVVGRPLVANKTFPDTRFKRLELALRQKALVGSTRPTLSPLGRTTYIGHFSSRLLLRRIAGGTILLVGTLDSLAALPHAIVSRRCLGKEVKRGPLSRDD